MDIKEIRVQKGEKIQTAWARLVRWAETLKVIQGEGIKVRETPKGTIVSFIRNREPYNHPFKASTSEYYASVRAGMVNGQTPYIFDVFSSDWRRIDNRDKDGNKFSTEKPSPSMRIDLSKNKDRKFYLSLRVKPNDVGIIVDAKEHLRIVQTETANGDNDGAGYYPLALFHLNTDRTSIEESFQIVHHNMRYLYQARKPSEDTKTENSTYEGSTENKTTGNRHLFFPV